MSTASSAERLMLDLMNAARANVGLDPLKLALDLNESAENHSEWMLDADRFSHTGAGGSNAGERMSDAGFRFSGSWSWGENIAWQSERGSSGIRDDVRDLFQSLMNSPGHRANILSSEFEYVGIGVEIGDYNGWEAVMVTQNFAKTGASVALDTGGGSTTPSQPDSPTNAAPVVTVDDITVAKVTGRKKKAWLEDYVDTSDADGDTIVFFELRDEAGPHNFKLKGVPGRIDARDGFVIDADQLDEILVIRDKKVGSSTLEIRAHDGEDWGAWEEFTLNTLHRDDYFA